MVAARGALGDSVTEDGTAVLWTPHKVVPEATHGLGRMPVFTGRSHDDSMHKP